MKVELGEKLKKNSRGKYAWQVVEAFVEALSE